MKKAAYLYVIRDDGEYDYKAGFASYTEANNYRQECQHSWMGPLRLCISLDRLRENQPHKNAG